MFGLQVDIYCGRLSSIVRKIPPKLVWTISVRDAEPAADQIVNHYEGISCLTTKNGLCDLLRDLNWVSADLSEVSPR